MIQTWQAIVQGVVEGLTEFLPVSSTGHLIISSHFLGIGESDASKALDVIIQSGAMLAVIWHYRRELFQITRQFLTRRQPGLTQGFTVIVAVLPSAVLGLLFRKAIKAHLFGIGPVALALVAGGIAMLVVERKLRRSPRPVAPASGDLTRWPTVKQALQIGCFQCLALWPGMSRSMTTILGARWVGLDGFQAASFSFLLAIPTLFGASLLDLYKSREILSASGGDFAINLLIGTAVSFAVALVVIRGLLNYVRSHGFEVFAIYRIAAGIALWCLLANGQ